MKCFKCDVVIENPEVAVCPACGDKKGVGWWDIHVDHLIKLTLVARLYEESILHVLRKKGYGVTSRLRPGWLEIRVKPVIKREWREFAREVGRGVIPVDKLFQVKRALSRLPVVGSKVNLAGEKGGSAELRALGVRFSWKWESLPSA